MKFLKVILLITIVAAVLSKKFIPATNHVVYDRRPEVAQLSHIVRPNPTITVTNRYGHPTYSRPSRTVSFSNNNDNNAANLGTLGKSAIIASKICL